MGQSVLAIGHHFVGARARMIPILYATLLSAAIFFFVLTIFDSLNGFTYTYNTSIHWYLKANDHAKQQHPRVYSKHFHNDSYKALCIYLYLYLVKMACDQIKAQCSSSYYANKISSIYT